MAIVNKLNLLLALLTWSPEYITGVSEGPSEKWGKKKKMYEFLYSSAERSREWRLPAADAARSSGSFFLLIIYLEGLRRGPHVM